MIHSSSSALSGKAIKNKQWGSAFGFGFINIYVGLLEILSHFIRIISFTFRLFGNMTAGEILLGVMTFLVAFIVPVVFYGLETLVGLPSSHDIRRFDARIRCNGSNPAL